MGHCIPFKKFNNTLWHYVDEVLAYYMRKALSIKEFSDSIDVSSVSFNRKTINPANLFRDLLKLFDVLRMASKLKKVPYEFSSKKLFEKDCTQLEKDLYEVVPNKLPFCVVRSLDWGPSWDDVYDMSFEVIDHKYRHPHVLNEVVDILKNLNDKYLELELPEYIHADITWLLSPDNGRSFYP
jgi:hypothetical protein